MISQPIIRDTFVLLETFEKGLNIVGYIPVVGTVSAGVRNFYGRTEMIVGIASSILALVVHLNGQSQAATTYISLAVTFIGHGVLNELRSYIEAVPFLPLGTTLPYDLYATHIVGKRVFSYL